MSESDDKAELLNRLVLDKGDDEVPKGPLWQRPWLVAPICIVAGVAIAHFLLAPESSAPTPIAQVQASTAQPAPAQIQREDDVQRALEAPGQEILNASGYVTARLMATVSAELMGLIKSVEVEEGMQVEQGQVLATLDDTIARVNWELAQAQYESQRARLESANSELEEAQRVLARQQELRPKNLTSEAELTRASSNVERLAANIRSMKSELEVSRLQAKGQQERLEKHTIRSPFSGVVTVKNAQPGEIIAPSSAGGGFTRTGVCTIVDMNSLEIEVDVNEAFIGRVFPGQKVIANLDAYPSWDIPASVIAVIPTADRSKATVQVRIQILDKDQRVLPDMGVKVAFFSQE